MRIPYNIQKKAKETKNRITAMFFASSHFTTVENRSIDDSCPLCKA